MPGSAGILPAPDLPPGSRAALAVLRAWCATSRLTQIGPEYEMGHLFVPPGRECVVPKPTTALHFADAGRLGIGTTRGGICLSLDAMKAGRADSTGIALARERGWGFAHGRSVLSRRCRRCAGQRRHQRADPPMTPHASARLVALDFSRDIARLTQNFSGREWLFEEIAEWFATGHERFFVPTYQSTGVLNGWAELWGTFTPGDRRGSTMAE
jgi:hypothetical protein